MCLILSYRSRMPCLFICLFSLVFFLCFILVYFHCYIFVFTDDFFCMSNVLRIPCHVFFLSAKCVFHLLKVPFGSFYIFHLTSHHVHGFLYILALPECIYHRCFNVLSADIIISVILVSVSTDWFFCWSWIIFSCSFVCPLIFTGWSTLRTLQRWGLGSLLQSFN